MPLEVPVTVFADLKAQCDWLAAHFSHAPGNDNVNNIWNELEPSLEGGSYCAAGVSWEWKHANRPLPAIDRPYGFINCEDARQWAIRHGMWDTSGHYSPGDAGLFNWKGGTTAEHVATIIADNGIAAHTFECNTGSGNSGSQSNGDGCYYRIRPHGAMFLGAIKFSRYFAAKPTPTPVPQILGHLPLAADGVPGLQTYAALQRAVGASIDGIPGPDTWKHVQARVKVTQDGIPGPRTWDAIQRHVGAAVDGIPGKKTWRAVQVALNAKKF
jgi:peptidoglycan hydrolase-like protein with peptidoglycan-binding domain